jgi:hypothetical protein
MKYIVLLFLMLLPLSGIALAENTTYKQQILPIDCLYEVIDVGTQKLRYLTPETCPIDPGPPVITEPSGDTPVDNPEGTPDTNWVYIAPIAIAPPDTVTTETDKGEVQGSTEEIIDIVIKNRDSIVLLTLLSAAWIGSVIMWQKRHSRN